MGVPTIIELLEDHHAVVSQQVDPAEVAVVLSRIVSDIDIKATQHHAKYVCDRTVITSITDATTLDEIRSQLKKTGFHAVSLPEFRGLKSKYQCHWRLSFNEDGSGELKDPEAGLEIQFKDFGELLN